MSSGLHLTNTLSNRKEPFHIDAGKKVKLFTCGPSVYSKAHIGNYRTFLYEDVLQRYLEYSGYEVERMINFTDVEDKAIAETADRGISLKELTGPVEEKFFEEANLLAIKLPDYIPRATTSVDQAVYLIKILLDRGYAYRHGKDIFYDPLKFDDFGKLYGLDMGRWPKQRRRFRRDTYPGQRWNLGDFILWHGEQPGDVYWDTELGKGRPAWNIQDAAMISKHLGYKIDVACGGVDNLYRHHDYTIAVMEAVSGQKFASFWLHGEHLLVNRRKMSKSRGNIVYLEELLKQGFTPKKVRFFLMYEHYRKSLNFTKENLEMIAGRLASVTEIVRRLSLKPSSNNATLEQAQDLIRTMEEGFRNRMDDDLDVKGAFDMIHQTLIRLRADQADGRFGPRAAAQLQETMSGIDHVFQVLGDGGW